MDGGTGRAVESHSLTLSLLVLVVQYSGSGSGKYKINIFATVAIVPTIIVGLALVSWSPLAGVQVGTHRPQQVHTY